MSTEHVCTTVGPLYLWLLHLHIQPTDGSIHDSGLTVVLFQCLKYVLSPPSSLHDSWWEIHWHSIPMGKLLFFFGCFPDFLFLWFSEVWWWHVFVWISLVFLFGAHSPSWICRFMSHLIWEVFSYSFFRNIIHLLPLSLFFWNSDDRNLCYSPTGIWGSVSGFFWCVFLSIFSLCSSDLVICIILSLSSCILPSVPSILLLSSSTEF